RELTLLSPILDAHLSTGDRANATLFPISTSGNTITIRRFSRNPWTLVDFIDKKMNTLSEEMAAFLWLCMQYEINMLVVGGTASGKTSTLNTLCALIPPSNRTVTIEDTRELSLPQYLKWNWVPLTTRNPNPEGQGAVRMLDLMVTSLRMRPDRIIVGEIRRRREAEVLFEAMHTGHAVCSTMHADTASQVLRRLTHPPIELPLTELESLQLIVVQYRDRRKEIRRVYEISELVVSPVEAVVLNSLFKWKPRTDTFEKVNESSRVLEDLNLHTGMSADEIKRDIKDKLKILEWMDASGIRSVDEVGAVIGLYYKSPEVVLKAAGNKLPLKKVL
ncbi:MAG: type II/IV secretion system ATPase subunit, partial [Candidatus Micrarchaeota archaeon]|nr:type II/IV secretion system ATPase subunit [Candidatus Micrarchaeota archaeon]